MFGYEWDFSIKLNEFLIFILGIIGSRTALTFSPKCKAKLEEIELVVCANNECYSIKSISEIKDMQEKIRKSFSEQASLLKDENAAKDFIEKGTKLMLGFEVKTKNAVFVSYFLEPALLDEENNLIKDIATKSKILAKRIKELFSYKDEETILDNTHILERFIQLNTGNIFPLKNFVLTLRLTDNLGRKSKWFKYRYDLQKENEDLSKIFEELHRIEAGTQR